MKINFHAEKKVETSYINKNISRMRIKKHIACLTLGLPSCYRHFGISHHRHKRPTAFPITWKRPPGTIRR